MLSQRINSVFIHVNNLRKSAEWYSNLLGIKLLEERLNGGPVYWIDLEEYTGIILDDNSDNKKREDWNINLAPKCMFGAEDIQKAYEEFQARGIEISLELETPHEGLTLFNYRDLDGNVFMVCSANDNSPPVERVSHSPVKNCIPAIFVDVTDIQKATAWHFSLFGLDQIDVEENETIVQISSEVGADILLDSNRYLNGENYNILFMFDTNDIDEAFSFVKEKGMNVFTEIERNVFVSFFTIKDPDNNVIMICQSHE